jgi:hypothetical protein
MVFFFLPSFALCCTIKESGFLAPGVFGSDISEGI